MQSDSLFSKFLRLLLCFFITVSAILAPSESYAVYEGVRDNIDYDSNNYRCNTGELDFNPFGTNKDSEIKFDNPTCISYLAGVGATMVAAHFLGKRLCTPTNPLGQPASAAETAADIALPMMPWISPLTLVKIAQMGGQCATRGTEYGIFQGACAGGDPTSCANATLASKDTVTCCSSFALFGGTVAASVIALSVIWDIAHNTYRYARICGHDWQAWEKDGATNKWKKVKGPYRKCIEDAFLNNDTSCSYNGVNLTIDGNRAITNKYYREYIYGGKEFKDENGCKNPTTWDSIKRNRILGYSDDNQRYYMTGPGVPSVYACYRFLSKPVNEDDRAAAKASYDCCKQRSQNAICIENRIGVGDLASVNVGGGVVGDAVNNAVNSIGGYRNVFCEMGSRCTVANVTFEVYASKKETDYVCAKTYSVCPYDHLLGGGTEEKKYDTSDTSQVVNFCQAMNHCSKLPILPYVNSIDFDGGFVSSACYDMKGDSQNVYGYTSELIPINTRGFSAPMVQCFKETMENVFLNKAGVTKCLNADESPNEDGQCVSGYIFRKGFDLPTQSFFLKLQNNLQSVIKMVLTLSIVFFGVSILFAVPGAYIEKKKLIPYIVKIALVMYFAVGDGWQFGFMQGVLGTAGVMSDITFKVDEGVKGANLSEADRAAQLDGCQFPRYNYSDRNDSTKYNAPSYPPGKEYLRIWDILDCKIARALGFGPEVSVPNLILMILGGLFTGGYGILFFVGAFCFAFFLISLTIKAIHVFLMSITSVVLLMYISPVTITLSLFAKTKPIFDKWWKEMLSFTLQPMILFAYLGILITLFDKVIIGSDVRFSPSTVSINGANVPDLYGRIAPKRIVCDATANDNSMYCIFRVADIKTYTGFEVLGIGLPILGSINANKLYAILKAAILMFVFTKFLDQISYFASKLTGGTELKPEWGGMETMVSKSYDALKGIQKRGMRALKKHGGTAARKGMEGVKGITNAIGNRGKAVASISKESGADSTASSADKDKGADQIARSDDKTKGADNADSSKKPDSDTTGTKPVGGTDSTK